MHATDYDTLWYVFSSSVFFFQQIVNQIDQESDRCDNEEEKSDGEISEERYR